MPFERGQIVRINNTSPCIFMYGPSSPNTLTGHDLKVIRSYSHPTTRVSMVRVEFNNNEYRVLEECLHLYGTGAGAKCRRIKKKKIKKEAF